MKRKVNLIISIDTECDKGPGWKIPQPMAFRNITEGIPQVLTPLFKEFNIKPTYLLSPEVMKSQPCVDVLKSLNNAELGTHLHGEFITPGEIANADRAKTPQLEYSPQIENQKLHNLTELFVDKFGYRPRSFRAGRWGMSKYTLGFLEELGYKVDSSVCSFRTHYFDKASVNFWGAPLQPYHPSHMDFRKRGKMKIIEVPATLGNPHLMKLPEYVLKRISDKSRLHKKILGKLGLSSKINWLRPWKSTGEEMIRLSEAYIDQFGTNGKPVILNMMFHSNEILPGTSPYAQNQDDIAGYFKELRTYFTFISGLKGFTSKGLSEIV